jgi:acyl-lipid (8-3)-desaturase
MWKQQHVVGHHVFTNVHSEDPDIRVKPDGTDVRRVTPWQPHSIHHKLQHLYLGVLYSLLSFKSIFMDDFSALTSGRIGPVKLAKMRGHEMFSFWTGKVLFAFWWIASPVMWSSWNVLQLIGLWAVCLAVCGWTLALMFQVLFCFS